MSDIQHDTKMRRMHLTQDGKQAYLDYHLRNGVMDIQYTYTDPALRGQGLAGKLVAEALAWAQAENYKILPSCPYVGAWFRRHPEGQGQLA